MVDFTQIRAFAFDVDGVFTNGGVFANENGELYRTFDAKDGFAVRMAVMKGYPVGIITGGRSESIRQRFLTSGVPGDDVYLGSRNKIEQLQEFCQKHYLNADQILYIGDDIPDLDVIQVVGIGMCPADAVPEIKAVSDIVSEHNGGHLCVRDAIEKVLKAQGHWEFDTMLYKKLF